MRPCVLTPRVDPSRLCALILALPCAPFALRNDVDEEDLPAFTYISRSVSGEGIQNEYSPELCPGCSCGPEGCGDAAKCACCDEMQHMGAYTSEGPDQPIVTLF